MPTYTYVCSECGCRFDLFHSIMDNSEKACPECEGKASRQFGGGTAVKIGGGNSAIPAPPPPRSGFT